MDDQIDISYHWTEWLRLLRARCLELSADCRRAQLELRGWDTPQWVDIPPMLVVPEWAKRAYREAAQAVPDAQ